MAKKKKNIQSQQQLSPEQFIKQKARNLPVEVCYISKNIEEVGEGTVIVVRRHPNNKFTLALYLLDIFCLGVKDTFYRLRMDELEYEEWLDRYASVGVKEITYNEAHNWIYGAIAFAEEAGIAPHKDFGITQYILEEDTEEIPLIEYDYGKDGKHFLVAMNQLELSRYLPVLKKNLGDDFDYVMQEKDYDDEEESFGYFSEDNASDTQYTYEHPEYPSEIKLATPWLDEFFSSPDNAFYLSKEQIDRILSLPKDSLRHDLEQIVLYHIGRTYQITKADINAEEEYRMPITHALFFLSEVGNEESLDVVLEVLRQSPVFIAYHFGDTDEDIFVPVLYELGKNRLDKMMAFAKEEGLGTFSHYKIFPAVAYIAHNHPDRRDEIIEWFREMLRFTAEKLSETQYIDRTIAGLMMKDLLDLQAVELLLEIKAVFDTGLVDLSICGKYSKIEMKLRHPRSFQTWREYPHDIYGLYKHFNEKWG